VDGKNWVRERWRTGDLYRGNSYMSAQCQTIVYISGPHANVFLSYHDIPIPTSLPLVECHLKGEHQFLITILGGGGRSGYHRWLEARTLQGIEHAPHRSTNECDQPNNLFLLFFRFHSPSPASHEAWRWGMVALGPPLSPLLLNMKSEDVGQKPTHKKIDY
jgi:hypothetical protein